MNLNLKKAVEEIRLDDSPESPVYTLDFTDMGITGKSERMRECLAGFAELQGKPIDQGSAKVIADAYREVITVMLGEDAYGEIVDYVGGGTTAPEKMNVVLMPLVLWLLDQYNDIVTVNDSRVVQRYLREQLSDAAL